MKKFLIPMLVLLLFAATAQAAGFLSKDALPRSLDFLPPPPTENSPDFQRDQAIYRQTRVENTGARREQAAFDADSRGNWREFFREAFGLSLSEKTTPATCLLLTRAFDDFRAAARSAKDNYRRARPFVYDKAPGSTCTPGVEAFLAADGSYPSGHSTYGWGMALILAEISPERQAALLKRGLDFGYSRIVCGVHWASDVDAGRITGAAVVTQMHNSRDFLDLLAKAKAEIALLRARTAQ